MAWWRRRRDRGPAVSREGALACRPVRNPAVEELRLESGDVILAYPVRFTPWMSDLLHRFTGRAAPEGTRKLQLDELGTTVWGLIDGRRSVRQVSDAFAQAYRLHEREAEVSVTRFLYELGKRGLIAMRSDEY